MVPKMSQFSTSTVSISYLRSINPEGQTAPSECTFTVTRSGDTNQVQTVEYAVTGFVLTVPGSPFTGSTVDTTDFEGGVFPNGIVSFGIGETSKTITINVAGDSSIEGNEGFSVTLSNPSSGLTIDTNAGTATGTILNDDPGVVSYSFTNLSVLDRNSNVACGVLNGSIQVDRTTVLATVTGTLTFDPSESGLPTISGTPEAIAGPGSYVLRLGAPIAPQNPVSIGADPNGAGLLTLNWEDSTPTPTTIRGFYLAPGASVVSRFSTLGTKFVIEEGRLSGSS